MNCKYTANDCISVIILSQPELRAFIQCATDYLLSGRPLHELCDHNYKASGQWVSVFSGVQSGRENDTVQQTMGVFVISLSL